MAVRQELKANGVVAPEDHSFRVLVQRQDMTGADRAWANHYETGDVVRYARGSKSIGIEAGSYGTVAAINPICKSAYGRNAIRRTRHLRSAPAYRRQRLPRSCPRVLRWRPHSVHRAGQVSSASPTAILPSSSPSAPDGRIAARLDDNRQIEFNAAEHRHFDHGYAVTSHSAQGLTAERVLDPRRHRRPSRPAQLALRLRLRLPRQPRGDRLHRRCRETRPATRSRNQQDIRAGNRPAYANLARI